MAYEKQVALAKLAAKQQIGMLRTEINYHASHWKVSKKDMEQSYNRLQQEISKGRFVLRRLSTCIETTGNDPTDCDQVISLESLLEEAIVERSKLHELVFDTQKRDILKAFKQSISDMIQRGQAPRWISTVTREELINHGQEINRLYQFLVEGQGNTGGIPLVDSLTLARASERTDLFSTKQCAYLYERSVEVDKVMLKETEHLIQSLQENEVLEESRISLVTDDTHQVRSSSWVCDKCTFRNDGGVSCALCSEIQGPSFLTVAKRKLDKKIDENTSPPAAASRRAKEVIVKKPPVRGESGTNTVWVKNKHIPELIGPRGKNQKDLIAKTGATSIYAFQERLDKNGMCPVEVQGGRNAFQKVVDFLEKKFDRGPSVDSSPSRRMSEISSSETVWIRNEDVPKMIGPYGKTVQGLKAETGAKSITAWQELVKDDGMVPVVIRGNSVSVKKAATAIKSMLVNPFDVDSIIRSGRQETAAASNPSRKPPMKSNGERAGVAVVQPSSDASTTSTMTATLKSTLGVESRPARGVPMSPFNFLQKHNDCLTCPVDDFCTWLDSVQITKLEELQEALEDKEFASEEMKANGLKYFKRNALRKAIKAHQESTDPIPSLLPLSSPSPLVECDPPFELVCPIRHVLMTNDPVLAPDGYTYERDAIMEWLQRGDDTTLSPMTHQPLEDVTLVPNLLIRTMARDWYRANQKE